MKITTDKLVDKRLVRRHISRGLLSQADLDAHLSGLDDAGESSEPIAAQMAAVGIEDVAAKDTGEAE